MLYAFGFDRVGVVVSDLYFVDPDPTPGQEGPEHGVRLELRLLERMPLQGGVYSAQPIAVERPIWRADLLESVSNPGSFDRAHHHPTFTGWDPSHRVFDPTMAADPVEWVGRRLSDLDRIRDEAGVGADEVGAADADDLRGAVPEIVETVRRLLDRVRAGELGRPSPAGDGRVGWL
jgi:hypothetical protein